MDTPYNWGTKFCLSGPDHMTTMAAMPIYYKHIFQNQKAHYLGPLCNRVCMQHWIMLKEHEKGSYKLNGSAV